MLFKRFCLNWVCALIWWLTISTQTYAFHPSTTQQDWPSDLTAPIVEVSLEGGINRGWFLRTALQGFALTPNDHLGFDREGEGALSIFINGKRHGTAFSSLYQLPDLPPGPHRIFVGLMTNAGLDLFQDGQPLGSALQITIPDPPGRSFTTSSASKPDENLIELSERVAVWLTLIVLILNVATKGSVVSRTTSARVQIICSWTALVCIGFLLAVPFVTGNKRTSLRSLPVGSSFSAYDSRTGESIDSHDFVGRFTLVQFSPDTCSEACLLGLNRAARTAHQLHELGTEFAIVHLAAYSNNSEGRLADLGSIAEISRSIRSIAPPTGVYERIAESFRVDTNADPRSEWPTFLFDATGRPVLRVPSRWTSEELVRGISNEAIGR